MSREIKYRVWDSENKSYDDPYSYAYYALTQDGGLDFYCHGDCMGSCDPAKYIIEQYTGLKDKNGVEIYEGDIVANGTLTGIVEYKVDDFCAWTVGTTTNGIVLLSGSWTVIGNIHESNMEELCPKE